MTSQCCELPPQYQYDLAKAIYENYRNVPDREYVTAALESVHDSTGIDNFYDILTAVYEVSEESYNSSCVSMMSMIETANQKMIFCKEDIISYIDKTLTPYPEIRDDVVSSMVVFLGDGDFREFFRELVKPNFEALYHTALQKMIQGELYGEPLI